MRRSLHTILLLLTLAVSVSAQESSPSTKLEATDRCTNELVQSAQKAFEIMRWRGSEGVALAERRLREVAWLCQERPAGDHAKELLKAVHEDIANSNLAIARFYLSKFYHGRGGNAGALSRLERIIEKYPNYSKLDQVLSLFVQAHAMSGDVDKAISYYLRLTTDFPSSQYINDAAIALNSPGVRKASNSRPTP